MNVQSNWWESFFEGVAVDMWLQALPPEHSEREAESLARVLAVPSGAEVLDVPCGGGRLSLALARRGYRLTGVDWSPEFLAHARSRDAAHGVTWEQRDMRDLPWRDAVRRRVLPRQQLRLPRRRGERGVSASGGSGAEAGRALRAGDAHGAREPARAPQRSSVVESGRRAPARRQSLRSHADAPRDRYTFVSNGRVDVRSGSHRAYSYRELVELIEAAGFSVELAEPWTREAHTVSFVATRT